MVSKSVSLLITKTGIAREGRMCFNIVKVRNGQTRGKGVVAWEI